MAKLALIYCGQILAIDRLGEGTPIRGELLNDIKIIENGVIVVSGERIIAVGSPRKLTPMLDEISSDRIIDCGGALVTPGLVDPHTHAVFAGTREGEYELRIKGASYMEIAAQGGGILNTVKRVRNASEDDLVEQALPRLKRALQNGTTTMEVKSGYGLDTGTELKMLRAIRRLNELQPIALVPTFLGAHEVPDEFRSGRKNEYIRLVINEMLSAVADEGLAEFCDVFCEKGVFTPDETAQILAAAKDLGFGVRIHADEIESTGGAELAARLGADSADHLAAISDDGVDAIANSNTVATLLPGTSFFLGLPQYAPARRLIDAGAVVALATDFNPGSSPTTNLPLVMSIACSRMGMTPLEAWVAATVNAAYSLGRAGEVGVIAPGHRADLVVWEAKDYREVPYFYGENLVQKVVKDGEVVYSR